MKISSASKKVLASALSAAMVVAFAPTAAFAAIDKDTQVKITFDLNGGEFASSSNISSIPYETGTVVDNYVAGTAEAWTAVAADTTKDATQFYSAKDTSAQLNAWNELAIGQIVYKHVDAVAGEYSENIAVTESLKKTDPSNYVWYNDTNKVVEDWDTAPSYVKMIITAPADATYEEHTVTATDVAGGAAEASKYYKTPEGATDEDAGAKLSYWTNLAAGQTVYTYTPAVPATGYTKGLQLTGAYGSLTATNMPTKNGGALDYWFVDANGDGNYKASDGDVKAEGGWLDVSTDATSGTEVKLTAHYASPELAPSIVANSLSGEMVVNSITMGVGGVEDDIQYSAKLAFPDGTTVVNAELALMGSALKGGTKFSFALTPAQVKAMTAGTYTFTVSDAEHGTVATKAIKMYTVQLSAGAGYCTYVPGAVTSFVVAAGADDKATFAYSALAKPENSTVGGYHFSGYTDGTAKYSTGDTITIKGDTTLTAYYDNPQVGTVNMAIDNADASKGKGELTFTPSLDNGDIDLATDQWNATVTGPDGLSKVIKNVKNATPVTLTFGATWESDTAVTNKLAAGTYTVTIAPAAQQGQTLSDKAALAPAVESGSVTLAAVTYDLGDGSWTYKNAKGEIAQPKTLPVLAVAGTKLADFAATIGAFSAANFESNDALQEFDYLTVNGKKVSALKDKDVVDAAGVTVAAAYKTSYIAAPAVSFTANGATKFDMTVTAAEGTRAYYKTSGMAAYAPVPDNGVVTLAPATDTNVAVRVQTTAAGTVTYSKPVTYVATKAAAENVKAFADTFAVAETSVSTKNKPARYGDTLTTLAADAKAAVAAPGYLTQKDLNALVVEQEAGVLDKVIGVEKANLEAKKALTKSADGKTYTVLTDAVYDEAVAKLAKAAEAFAANNNYDTDGTTLLAKDDVAKVAGFAGVEYNVAGDTAAQYLAAVKGIAAGAPVTTVAAADAEAAIAVTEALKAATTGEAAEAALAAYAALTDAQKALVATADVAAAEVVKAAADKAAAEEEAKKAAEEAAAALAAEQDKAAVNYVNSTKSKTVKLAKGAKATKKAQTITYKSKVSASGNVVTYAKVSGSAKIKVAAAGTATLKKGAKAGTYTAKVKVTCGSAERTVKVKFVVK